VRIYGARILKEKRIVAKINNDYICIMFVLLHDHESKVLYIYRYINSRIRRYYIVDSYLNSDRSETISKRRSIFLPQNVIIYITTLGVLYSATINLKLTLNTFVELPSIYFTMSGKLYNKCLETVERIKLFYNININIK